MYASDSSELKKKHCKKKDTKNEGKNDTLKIDTNKMEPDWKLARRGIQLVLNNKFDEAIKCFGDKDRSIQLAAGYCYVMFLMAVMTFEEKTINKAISVLQELEKRCAENLGWLKTMKQKFSPHQDMSQYHFDEEIMLADCQVCLALLNGLTNDNTAAYIKSGWILRKSWRLYQHTYSTLLIMYKKTFGISADVPGCNSPSWRVIMQHSGMSPQSPTCPWQFPNSSSKSTAATPTESYRSTFWRLFGSPPPTQEVYISELELTRLISAVSFGYGLFHLVVSLLPPPLLRLMQMFGFAGDRAVGLDALMFARLGPDMRAPLATLALLWYHTIVRPYYAIDGHNLDAGVEAASLLIEESNKDYSNSCVFLFFRGRILRLKSQIEPSIDMYSRALNKSCQRELNLLCLHEIAWCRLIQLDFNKASHLFNELRQSSHWGQLFYQYCYYVCNGSVGKEESNRPVKSKKGGKHKELDALINKRLSAHFSSSHSPFYYRLLAYELLYMWNNMPCSTYTPRIIEDCEANADEPEPMVGLKQLSTGVCLSCTGKLDKAEQCFKEVIKMRCNIPTSAPDAHIEVFANYELAVLKLKAPNTSDGAKVFLQRINSYKGYDLEHQLSFRIHAANNLTKLNTQ